MKIRRLLGIAVLVLVAASVGYGLTREWREVPSRAAMRQYRAQQISDDELRELYAASVARVEQVRAAAGKQSEDAARKRADVESKCSDIAFREKNTAVCLKGGLVFSGYHQRGVEETFELAVLGHCAYVEAVREAKKRDCLPR